MKINTSPSTIASSFQVNRFIGVTIGIFFLWLCGTGAFLVTMFVNAMEMACRNHRAPPPWQSLIKAWLI